MSRSKKPKRPGWQERQRRQERADDKLFDDVAADTAAVFTCSHSLADDCSSHCARRLEELETDIDFNQVAVEMWSGRPGRAAELADLLGALLRERKRQQEVLTELHQRFESLAADDDFHEHLDPVEQWKRFVHQRLFEAPPQG